jgi:DNA polymerase II large subunit
MFHAAMRRNCDGDEACCILLMDAILNFSRSFLPDKRGSRTMDAPLVLTSLLIPSEVDDEVHGLDRVWKYPLDLYEGALLFKNPSEVHIQQLDHVLGTEKQYEGFGYTHKISNINSGILCSAYKTLVTMQEKLSGQMDLAEKIRAVDENDVARLVIEKHLLRDIKGNLRKFSMQQFRCSGCNEKFRRPPLMGKCPKCGGKIIFTISEGSIVKYLEPSISLAKKYHLSTYLRQSLELTKRMIEDVFGKEKDKQIGLGSWF